MENNVQVVNGQYVLDSRKVAEMINVRHDHLMRDIDRYVHVISENPNLGSQDFFVEASYKTNGNNKTYRRYDVTQKGCEMIANKLTGDKGIMFTAVYVDLFNKMKQNQHRDSYMIDDPIERAKAWIAEQEAHQKQIAEMKPGYEFAKAVESSVNCIDVGNFAKLVSKKLDICFGRNTAFRWLREHGYLRDNNTPYQQYINCGWFEVIEYTYNYGRSTGLKTLITGKGQIALTKKIMEFYHIEVA